MNKAVPRHARSRPLWLITAVLLLLAAPVIRTGVAASPAGPQVVTVAGIHAGPQAGGRPTALGVWHAGNQFIIADSAYGTLMIADGVTHAVTITIPASRNVYHGALVVNETYGRAYAASRDGDQGNGPGSGAIYVVDLATRALLTTIPPRVALGNSFALGHDETRDRVYVADYERVSWIDVATNAITQVPLPAGVASYLFRPEEMAVNPATNEVFMVQRGAYDLRRLWILDADDWTWTWIDFAAFGPAAPRHIAVSTAYNKVIVTMDGVPGQAQPGIMTLNRADGSRTFVGAQDYGGLALNPASGRLYTGAGAALRVGVLEMATGELNHIAPPGFNGGATVVGVRHATDRAFIADEEQILIIDGASRTFLQLPTHYQGSGGPLFQDVAVNQDTGWVYIIPDDNFGEVLAIQDQPAGPFPPPQATPTATSTVPPGSTATPTVTRTQAPHLKYLPLLLSWGAQPDRTPTPTATRTPTRTPSVTPTRTPPTGRAGHWSGLTSRGHPVEFTVSPDGTLWSAFSVYADWSTTSCGSLASGFVKATSPGPGLITGDEFAGVGTSFSFTGRFTGDSVAAGSYTITNLTITIGLPDPPYVCYYTFSQAGGWSAQPDGAAQ